MAKAKQPATTRNKFSEGEYKEFDRLAKHRSTESQHNSVFAEGQDTITLELEASAETAHSIDDRIKEFLTRYNAQNAQGKPLEYTGGNRTRWKNPKNDEWIEGPKLGGLLEKHKEWALLDDFEVANSFKDKSAIAPGTVDMREYDYRNNEPINADEFSPSSMRVVISRDPRLIAEMSTGQRWTSCMSDEGSNHRYVKHDIEQGTLVAYVVAADDTEARYPLMRQLLKPYRGPGGRTILVPVKVYGGDGAGNSQTRELLEQTTRKFVSERTNIGAPNGDYEMERNLYGDGDVTLISLGGGRGNMVRSITEYIESSKEEYVTELHTAKRNLTYARADLSRIAADPNANQEALVRAQKKEKEASQQITSSQKALINLSRPEQLARSYFRHYRDVALDGALPNPELIEEAIKTEEVQRAIADRGLVALIYGGSENQVSQHLKNYAPKNLVDKFYLNPSVRERLVQVLENHEFTTIDLKNTQGSVQDVMYMLCALVSGQQKHPDTLQNLNISTLRPDDAGLEVLTRGIPRMTGLRSIAVTASTGGINNEGTEHRLTQLVRAVAEHGKLEHVSFAEGDPNGVVKANSATVDAIIDILDKTPIRSLNLSKIDFADSVDCDDVVRLAYAIERCKTLREFHISQDFIGQNGLEIISDAIVNNGKIETVDLSTVYGKDGYVDSMEPYINILQKTPVKTLVMNEVICPEGQVKAFGEVVGKNNTLRSLTWNSSSASDNDLASFMREIGKSTTLRDVKVSSTDIGRKTLDATADMIRKNQQLSSIEVSDGPISISGRDGIVTQVLEIFARHNVAKAVKTHESLTHVGRLGCSEGDAIDARIQGYVQRNIARQDSEGFAAAHVKRDPLVPDQSAQSPS